MIDPKMKKRMTILLVVLAVLFGGILLFNLVKGIMMKRFFAQFQSPTMAVSSVKAVQKNWRPQLAAVGNFVAINGVEVNAQVSGNVTAIHFTSGDFVEKNNLLLDIDDSIEQATLKANQADLDLQKVNYQRQIDLLKRSATATSSVDESKAKLLEAQANVEKTQALIHQKHIVAPFTGRLGIRQINLGQYILPGQTSIVSLQSLDPIFLDFYIPEQWVERVQLNQTIHFSVEQNPNILFEGKITAINSKIDTNTHTMHVQASLANCPVAALQDPFHSPLVTAKKHPLSDQTIVSCNSALNEKNKTVQFNFVPGMFAAIEIEQPSIPDVILLPSTAISYTLYGNSVFIIEKEHNKDTQQDVLKVRRVFVTTGKQQGNFTQILTGVKAGQLVVSSGELKLQDGMSVTINNDVPLPDIKNPDQLGQ